MSTKHLYSSTVRMDGVIANAVTGMGDPAYDKTAHYSVSALKLLPKHSLEALYAGSWLCGAIVDLYPREATREWLHIDMGGKRADRKEIEAFRTYSEKLGVAKHIATAGKWARLYGGAVLILVAEDGLPMDKPLRKESLRGIRALMPLDRYKITPYLVDTDVLNPELYQLNLPPRLGQDLQKLSGQSPRLGGGVLVHHSRVIRFDGVEMPPDIMEKNQGWGISIFDRIYDSFTRFESANTGAANLMEEASLFTYQMQGLSRMLSKNNPQGQAELANRLRNLRLQKGNLKLLLQDDKEQANILSRPLQGIPETMDRFLQQVVAASDIPTTVLLGRGPMGLAAQGTGDTEDKVWAKLVNQYQVNELSPKLRSPDQTGLFDLIWWAQDGPTTGKPPKQWSIEYEPLIQESQKEKLERIEKQANIDRTYKDMGVLLQDEIRSSRFDGPEFSHETQLDEKLWDEKKAEEDAFSDFGFGGGDEMGGDEMGGEAPSDGNGATPQFQQDSADPPKWMVEWQGLKFGVTHLPGMERHGKPMKAMYGNLQGSYGMAEDGMAIDFYIGRKLSSDKVFKIIQIKPDTGLVDERKWIIGVDSAEEATSLYLQHMPRKFLGGVEIGSLQELAQFRADCSADCGCSLGSKKGDLDAQESDSDRDSAVPQKRRKKKGSTSQQSSRSRSDSLRADGLRASLTAGEYVDPELLLSHPDFLNKLQALPFEDLQEQYPNVARSLSQALSLSERADAKKMGKPGHHWVDDPTVKGGGYWRKNPGAKGMPLAELEPPASGLNQSHRKRRALLMAGIGAIAIPAGILALNRGIRQPSVDVAISSHRPPDNSLPSVEAMQNAQLRPIDPKSVNATSPIFTATVDGKEYFVKKQHPLWAINEVLTVDVARQVGLGDRVVPVMAFTKDNDTYTVNPLLKDIESADRRHFAKANRSELAKMVAFDYLIGNDDRHQDNVLSSKSRGLLLIDNSLGFKGHGLFSNLPNPNVIQLAGVKDPDFKLSPDFVRGLVAQERGIMRAIDRHASGLHPIHRSPMKQDIRRRIDTFRQMEKTGDYRIRQILDSVTLEKPQFYDRYFSFIEKQRRNRKDAADRAERAGYHWVDDKRVKEGGYWRKNPDGKGHAGAIATVAGVAVVGAGAAVLASRRNKPTPEPKSLTSDLMSKTSEAVSMTSEEMSKLPMGAIAAGAVAVGVPTATYIESRRRYRANFDKSAQEAIAMSADIEVDEMQPWEQDVTIAVAGFAGMKGRAGMHFRRSIEEVLPESQHVRSIRYPEFDIDPKDRTKGPMGLMLSKILKDGKNPAAVRMAATAYAYRQKYPDKPINMVGYSGGGMVTHEAAELMKRMGFGPDEVRIANFGSPYYGLTEKYGQAVTFTSESDDVVPSQRTRDSVFINALQSHNQYLANPVVQKSLGLYLDRVIEDSEVQDACELIKRPPLTTTFTEPSANIKARHAAIVAEAQALGLSKAEYRQKRRQYQKNLDRSVQKAMDLAATLEVQDLKYTQTSILLANSGTATASRAGAQNRLTRLLYDVMPDHYYIEAVRRPEDGKAATSTTEMLANMLESGENPAAIHLAATAYAYKKKYEEENPEMKVNLLGFGDGGIVTHEAAALLARMGVHPEDFRVANLGSSSTGLAEPYRASIEIGSQSTTGESRGSAALNEALDHERYLEDSQTQTNLTLYLSGWLNTREFFHFLNRQEENRRAYTDAAELDEADLIRDRAVELARPVVNGWIGQIKDWLAEQQSSGASLEELRQSAPELYGRLDADYFASHFQSMSKLAHLMGQDEASEEEGDRADAQSRKTKPGHHWVDDKRVKEGGYWRKNPDGKGHAGAIATVAGVAAVGAGMGVLASRRNQPPEPKSLTSDLMSKTSEVVSVTSEEMSKLPMGAIAAGAATIGVPTAAYIESRRRYRANFDKSAEEAIAMSAKVKVDELGEDTKDVVVGVYGFTGLHGRGGKYLEDDLEEGLLKRHHVTTIRYPEFDIKRDEPFGAYKLMLSKVLKDGKNPAAIRMAATVYAYRQKYPDKPINMVGYSGGGMVTHEAAELLKRMGVPPEEVRLANFGSPYWGLTEKYGQAVTFTSEHDKVVKPKRSRDRVYANNVFEHNKYLYDPMVKLALDAYLSRKMDEEEVRQFMARDFRGDAAELDEADLIRDRAVELARPVVSERIDQIKDWLAEQQSSGASLEELRQSAPELYGRLDADYFASHFQSMNKLAHLMGQDEASEEEGDRIDY